MRLKTKIILICCISILFSSIVCSAAVFLLAKKNFFEAAEGQSFKMAVASISKLEDRIRALDDAKEGSVDRKVLEYIFKQQQDELLICFSDVGEEEIFNSTVFTQSDFEMLNYTVISDRIQMAELQWEGMYFFVYQQLGDGYSLYKLENVTYVWERMRLLGLGLVLLSCVITMFVCLLLYLVLNRVLSPLQKLNEGAKQIARGRYEERIAVERKGEIGELSENFNQMAGAVQLRIGELKEAEWRRTLFMGNLTHELKTPMTAISGYAKTLLTVRLPEEDREEALSYIYKESCRLERLSKKLMDLLLLEEEDAIELMEVRADVLFHNAAEACGRSLEEDGIRLECHGESEIFFVDAELFTEVLINLIDNARKASGRGDSIILSAAEKVIEVRDFGKGIPEEEKEKIVEPFYMIDKSRNRKSGGAGLGLAITAMILKRHRCRLQIESEVGRGTRMILQFV